MSVIFPSSFRASRVLDVKLEQLYRRELMKKHLIQAALVSALAIPSAFGLTSERLGKGTITFYKPLGGPADVVVAKLTLQPGDATAWHYHPGFVYVVIAQGTITEESGCGEVETFAPGTAFEEVQPARIHRVMNHGSDAAVLYVMNINPAGAANSTTVAGPLCGGPQTVFECFSNGWMKYEFPRAFKSQGDCITFVQSELPICDHEHEAGDATHR